jgi:glycosyltransferase involved in cell wall biosynthesis
VTSSIAPSDRDLDRAPAPLVSIVTISRNDPDGLLRTLRSVAEQSFSGFEHILVLEGSSIVPDEWADARQRLVKASATGISNAMNAGVSVAAGHWVQFVNGGDAYADSDALREMVASATQEVDMVCAFARVGNRGFTLPRQALQPGRDVFLYVSHQATLFRRGLFSTHGMFSSAYRIRMDLEWLSRLPTTSVYCFLDRITIDFDPNGVSSNRVVASSREEFSILWRRADLRWRAVKVALLLLPFRIIRREYRRLFVAGRG